MGTKVKGLLKGLRYISQIFDEPKDEPEFQIGVPTDVKHVAHIGWENNGPTVDSPSWMKGFESKEGGQQSAKGFESTEGSNQSAKSFESAEGSYKSTKSSVEEGSHKSAKSSVEDSSKKIGHRISNSLGGDQPDVPKSTRRTSSLDDATARSTSPKKEKSRHSRRHHSRDSSGSSKLNQDGDVSSNSPARDLPDIPRKTRRKKSKDSTSSRSSSKPKAVGSVSDTESYIKSRSSDSAKDKENSEAGS